MRVRVCHSVSGSTVMIQSRSVVMFSLSLIPSMSALNVYAEPSCMPCVFVPSREEKKRKEKSHSAVTWQSPFCCSHRPRPGLLVYCFLLSGAGSSCPVKYERGRPDVCLCHGPHAVSSRLSTAPISGAGRVGGHPRQSDQTDGQPSIGCES